MEGTSRQRYTKRVGKGQTLILQTFLCENGEEKENALSEDNSP
jgi:hypothetical protein